jgi:hypothetical protein
MVSQYIAASLVAYAAADLQPLAAGTKHNSSSTAPSNSLVSSSSKATALLWEQIEQSGILQQPAELPDALDIDPHVLQCCGARHTEIGEAMHLQHHVDALALH